MIFRKDYGFDLGTTYMHICQKEKGVILNEPEAIAIDQESKRAIAVGNEAYDMFEKTPYSIKINMPVKYGVIADFDHMINLLDAQCRNLKIGKNGKPTALVCVPYHISEVERRALYDLFMRSKTKFKNVLMVEKPLAAGLGCGIDVLEPEGHMLVDIGGGTTEISVISLGGVVISDLLKIGGERLDINLRNHVKKNYNVYIGLKTAEKIKKEIASVYGNQEDISINVVGRDVISGLPRNIVVTGKDVFASIKEEISSIIDAIKLVLEKTPPELSADILLSGIFLSGGTAGIKNIGELITKETNLPVHVPEKPAQSVINGVCHILNNYNRHKNILFTLKE